jgi:hypothetical protein
VYIPKENSFEANNALLGVCGKACSDATDGNTNREKTGNVGHWKVLQRKQETDGSLLL